MLQAITDRIRDADILSRLWASRPSADFLTIHYCYIIGMTLLGSLLILAGGDIQYIDALFLASSSCTQAGLATVNLNDLNTWQQVCMFLLASFTNPIVIHSATTFVRLYWFQKRFAHIVRETNMKLTMRKSKSRALSVDHEERGVGNREIRVLFDSARNVALSPRVNEPDDTDIEELKHASVGSDSSCEDRRISQLDAKASFEDDIPSSTRQIRIPDSASVSPMADAPVLEKERASDVTQDNTAIARLDSANSQAIMLDDEEEAQVGATNHAITNRQDDERKASRNVADVVQNDPGSSTAETADATRNTADIRFAELPVPRKHSAPMDQTLRTRANSMVDGFGTHEGNNLKRSITAEPLRSLGTALLEFGQRTMTMEGANKGYRVHRRRASSVSRNAYARSSTIERGVPTGIRRRRDSSPGRQQRSEIRTKEMMLPYISFQPTVGRNSAFIALSNEQRAELGGIEYRATKTLCKVLISYFFGLHLFGFVCYITWANTAQSYRPAVMAAGASRTWWSIFTSASAFNDLGLTLNADSFIQFQNAAFLLLISSFLIVVGNTGFPCFLRFVIWVAYRLCPTGQATKEEFAFLLDHPRRCFTLLFPGSATWWLFGILVALNGLDLVLFIVLDLGNAEITTIPVGYRIVDGLFQAFCTRTAGFTVVNLGTLHSAILVSYMIMMYISVFPVAISIRRTNVYEERSLGIYSADDEAEGGQQSFVGTHVRRQLGFDLWYVFLALFLICIIENPAIQDTTIQSINIFSILFEIVSAYGTVGLSIGLTSASYSLSGGFKTLSKLIIIAVQIRGRHRGLPLKLDRAVLLPSEKEVEREEEDAGIRMSRTMSRARTMSYARDTHA